MPFAEYRSRPAARRIEPRQHDRDGAVGLGRDEQRASVRRRRRMARRDERRRGARRTEGVERNGDCRGRSDRRARPRRAARRRRSRANASASEPSAAPHQLATSARVGAERGGKKRNLVPRKGVSAQCDRRARRFPARPRCDFDLVSTRLEGRAAREAEDLRLVVFALAQRQA